MGSFRLTGEVLTFPFNYHGFLTNFFLYSCSCKRHFQVTTADLNATGTNDTVETVLAIPDHELRDMILNVHLKHDGYITLYACQSVSLLHAEEGSRRERVKRERERAWKRRKNGVTLQEIMQQQISRSESDYAFLFAGQTSVGDEEVSDEAVHLAAATLATGYHGVWKKLGCPWFDDTISGGTLGEVDESEGDDATA